MKLNVTIFKQTPSSVICPKLDTILAHAVLIRVAICKGQVERGKRI